MGRFVLRRLGATILDADRIGHDVLSTVSVQQQIRERWGDHVFTARGDVDRPALGRSGLSAGISVVYR